MDASSIPPTPPDESALSSARDWVEAVTRRHLAAKEAEVDVEVTEVIDPSEVKVTEVIDPSEVKVTRVRRAERNEVQGILSDTFIVDFDYVVRDSGATKEASIFVKVPLKGQLINVVFCIL